MPRNDQCVLEIIASESAGRANVIRREKLSRAKLTKVVARPAQPDAAAMKAADLVLARFVARRSRAA